MEKCWWQLFAQVIQCWFGEKGPFLCIQEPLQAGGMQEVAFRLVAFPSQNGQAVSRDLAVGQTPVVSVEQEPCLQIGLDGLEREEMRTGFFRAAALVVVPEWQTAEPLL